MELLKRLRNAFKKKHPDMEDTDTEMRMGSEYKHKNSSSGKYQNSDLHELVEVKAFLDKLSMIDTESRGDKLVIKANKGPSYVENRVMKYINMAVCELAPMIQHQAMHFVEEDMRTEADNLAKVAGDLLSDACCKKLSEHLED